MLSCKLTWACALCTRKDLQVFPASVNTQVINLLNGIWRNQLLSNKIQNVVVHWSLKIIIVICIKFMYKYLALCYFFPLFYSYTVCLFKRHFLFNVVFVLKVTIDMMMPFYSQQWTHYYLIYVSRKVQHRCPYHKVRFSLEKKVNERHFSN